MKRQFLDHLAATCNVLASAQAIGVEPASVYGLRRRDAAFAEQWTEALAAGYVMLETRLVGHALAGGGRTLADGGIASMPPIDQDFALKLLGTHRDRLRGIPARGGPRPTVATREETNAALRRHLDALAKATRRDEARAAAAAAGTES